jgi:hypothetical protein
MDRKTICEAQAAICGEQAGRGDSDRAFWLAEAQRWRALASEHAHAAISIDGVVCIAKAGALDREVQTRDGQPSRQT